jgi:hypothetical protein
VTLLFRHLGLLILLLDDPAAQFVTSRLINRNVASAETFALTRSWLKECHESHKSCPRSKLSQPPTRLIDVGDSDGSVPPRLYTTKPGEKLHYVALSYCWGGNNSLQTTTATLATMQSGIAWDELPLTLRDAMIATRVLHIRYIWIDSVCIVQDNPADVAKEIARMSEIYRNSYVTVCVASARSSVEGFLYPRTSPPPYKLMAEIPYRCPDEEMGSIVLCDHPHIYNFQEPIDERGWTLQEYLLSPRTLVYGTEQLRWVCRRGQFTDAGSTVNLPSPLPPPVATLPNSTLLKLPNARQLQDSPFIREDGFIWPWRAIVTTFTRRILSVPSDKLPALSGVATEYGLLLQAEYVAGLWSCDLPSELLWTPGGDNGRYADKTLHLRPSYRAPSWSWASIDSAISFHHCPGDFGVGGGKLSSYYTVHGEISEFLKVVEYDVEPAHPYLPYGSLKSGHLKLEGRLLQVEWLHISNVLIHPNDKIRATADALPDCLETGSGSTVISSVWCLEICSPGAEGDGTRGLMLKAETGESTYTRVGIFYFSFDSKLEAEEDEEDCEIFSRQWDQGQKEWFKGCEWRVVTIM